MATAGRIALSARIPASIRFAQRRRGRRERAPAVASAMILRQLILSPDITDPARRWPRLTHAAHPENARPSAAANQARFCALCANQKPRGVTPPRRAGHPGAPRARDRRADWCRRAVRRPGERSRGDQLQAARPVDAVRLPGSRLAAPDASRGAAPGRAVAVPRAAQDRHRSPLPAALSRHPPARRNCRAAAAPSASAASAFRYPAGKAVRPRHKS